MRNRILSITRSSIPYIKELRSLKAVKSASTAILMQQLDYWFDKYPRGFYKFLEPCKNNESYKEGDSWAEELGFSAKEFRTAFDNIGTRHLSKTAWTTAKDCFDGKYYCSYQDKIKGLTYYFRNHELLDVDLDLLVKSESTEMPIGELRRCRSGSYVDADRESTFIYTEITSEITSETTVEEPVATEEILDCEIVEEGGQSKEVNDSSLFSQQIQKQNYSASNQKPPIGQFSAATDSDILQEISKAIYDIKLRPWMQNSVNLKPEMNIAVWQSNKEYYSLPNGDANFIHIDKMLKKLESKLKQLNIESIKAYTDLQNYWRVAESLTNPEAATQAKKMAHNSEAMEKQARRQAILDAINKQKG